MKIIALLIAAALLVGACANTGSTIDPTHLQHQRDMNNN